MIFNGQIGPKQLTCHRAVRGSFDDWAIDCGTNPVSLWNAVKTALLTRQDEATFQRPSHKASGRQPNIFNLTLNLPRSVSVYYTVEQDTIIVRGFAYDTLGEPRDDFDGGGFYSEFEWGCPPDDA